MCPKLALLLAIASASAAPAPYLFQKPTMNRTQLVFVYAGDLWSVPRQGGDARRLTAGAGVETDPVFSPDGSLLAFTGNYDGGTDVFVMAAEGGVPKRLTWHPAPDIVLGWTPDGSRVLFTSPRTSYSRFSELFTVSKNGGFEEKVPVPMGFEASFSPDGKRLAYVPLSRAFAAWKRYRGGRTAPIWLANLDTGHIEKLPRSNSNDYNPMWSGDKLYFLSDRSGPVSLFAYDTKSKQVKQLVPNAGLDFKSASAGPGGIVYEQFGSIHIYDFKSGKSETVPIRLTGDLPEVRERLVNAGKRLSNAHISPTGARAVFEARGEIVTVPAEKGDARNLTNTPGINERDPAWSPDGKTIAYFSDESGEYELHLRAQNGMGEPVKIKLGDPPAFYFDPRWSPDNKKIAYRDCHLGLWYVDLDDKKPVRIAKDLYYPGTEMTPAWSPDSQWIAYTRRLKNYLGAIFVYSIGGATSTQITDGMSDAESPVFDKDGKYLYFTSSTDSGPSLEPDLHSAQRTVSRSIYLVVLDKNQASPFSPESDDEKAASEPHSPSVSAGDAHKVSVKIDFDKIGQRILAVPMPARRYVDLQIGKPGVLFAVEGAGFGFFAPGAAFSTTIHRFDLKSRKSDVAIAGVRGFEISQNGEKMLYRQADRWTIAAPRPITQSPAPAAAPAAPAAGPGVNVLKTDSIEVRSDPKMEWKQMYHEAWRIERDFFYDPGFHGYDLAAAEKKYTPYLENIGSRDDLNYLLAEMLGEMTVGHLRVTGGDQPAVTHIQTGLLGADYKIENGRYRFDRVYDGENWNPQLRAPLTQPGINVAAGDYLLAVNGRELRASDNVYSFFEATAEKSVVLKVGPDASGAGSREVTVVPLGTETGLRNLAWIEDNHRKVDRMTNGRVAYVYMPDTGFGGLTNFNRYFFAQVGKEAVIVDERFNGGGALATDIIEYLKRPLMSLAATRDGMDEQQPQGAIFGPKVMIVNEFAGSGGDAMPWYFKRAGLGKLVGKRTWGGLVGRAGAPPLMDGGVVTAPASGIWNPNGQWEVENRGIAPDIEVEHDPELVRQGRDPQLEKAVEVVMEELKRQPVPVPKRPDYPNYHKKAL
jgi:tricorn protease